MLTPTELRGEFETLSSCVNQLVLEWGRHFGSFAQLRRR